MGNSGSHSQALSGGDEKHGSDENPQKQAKPSLVPYEKAKAAERVLKSVHNWEVIAREANLHEDNSSPQKQLAKLQNGILLNQKRQKYWVDKMGKNCFMFYARDFYIVWSDDKNNYWQWTKLDSSGEEGVEVAKLVQVCWLEVRGGFDTKKLSPETFYEASFVIKIINSSCRFDCHPVNFTLILPDGSKHENKVNFEMLKPRDQWVEIPFGKFRTCDKNLGQVKIIMTETCKWWKGGLVIKGVKIQPKI